MPDYLADTFGTLRRNSYGRQIVSLWRPGGGVVTFNLLCTGTTHPYPDDTFYSVGRVPRKLLMKYLGIKMYLVRLRKPPVPVDEDWRCPETAQLALACAGIVSPRRVRRDVRK